MRLTWGGRQTLPLLLLAVVIVSTSGLLQLTHVFRLTTESAVGESDLIRDILASQIGQVAKDHPDDPLRALREDRGINLILQTISAQSPAVLFVAIFDSTDTAITHSMREKIGAPVEPLPPLPRPKNLRERIGLLARLTRSPQDYSIDSPLEVGGRPFATIRIGIAGVLLRDQVDRALRASLVGAGFQVGLAVLLGFVLAWVAGRRLREIEAGVTAIREGRYDTRIPETGVDEFSRLARDLNLLSEQFQREREDQDSRLGSIRQTVELLGEGVLTLGPDREIVLLNGATGRILQIDPGDSRGRRLDELLPDDHPVVRLAERLWDGGGDPLTVPLPTDEKLPAYVAIGHRIMGIDAPAGALIEFKEAAALEAIHSLTDQSRVLSRLGQMAAGVAHEISNPLQAIELALGAVRDSRGLSSQDVASHVRTAMEEIQRLQRAVSGFLRVARLRPLAPGPVDVNPLLEEIHRGMEAEANLSGLDLDLDSQGDLPETQADPDVLRQAVQNLVKNAIQALPSREGRVKLSGRATADEILISVADTGPGIPPENLERVFDLYFTTKEGGTGVGLALVRQAIEIHGGEVELQSTPGEGTVVTLRLPVRSASNRKQV